MYDDPIPLFGAYNANDGYALSVAMQDVRDAEYNLQLARKVVKQLELKVEQAWERVAVLDPKITT